MEGALPSVVGGLVGVPLVAVPTSVGYGASFGGLAALLAMLNSCAPGVTVVNIDNGFGAGVFAARVARNAAPRTSRVIGWVDASSGASGDMLLGALVGAGVPLGCSSEAVDAVAPEPVALAPEAVSPRTGSRPPGCTSTSPTARTHRTWRDVRGLLAAAALPDAVRGRALATFERLAVAEAAVHGIDPRRRALPRGRRPRRDRRRGRGRAPGFVAPRPRRAVVVSPVAVGSGTVRGAHGALPVPPPGGGRAAPRRPVVRRPGGPAATELCTPTGAALLTTLATA